MPRPHERQLRDAILRVGRMCWERGLLVALDGNLSARIADDLVLCTRAGCHKGLLTDADLVVVDLSGRRVRGRGEPTSELALHLACYARRPDVEAVVHAHPPTCVALTLAGQTLARCVLPEVVLTLGTVPTVPYETTGTTALARAVGEAAGAHDAVLLERHGAVCLGSSVLDAFCKLETLEHTAKIVVTARGLGGVAELPPAEAERLRRLGLTRYGGPPAAVAALDRPGVDLPDACRGCSGCATPSAGGIARPAGFTVARVTAGWSRAPGGPPP